MESTEEQIKFFNDSLSTIKERCHHVFGLDIDIEPVNLTPPDKYDSFMRAYEEHAAQQLARKSRALFEILSDQHIFNYPGYYLMSWTNTRRALTSLVTKLKKY